MVQIFQTRRAGIRRLSIFLIAISLPLVLMATCWPRDWRLGSLKISLNTTRVPSLLLEFALVMWAGSSATAIAFIRSAWKSGDWRKKTVLLFFGLNALLALFCVLNYPSHVLGNYRMAKNDLADEIQLRYEKNIVPIENFAARCAAVMPAHARILYHGLQEGWIFAYEVYPRRVFMQPADWWTLSANYHHKPWFRDLPDDPIEAYWRRNVPAAPQEHDEFVRSHRITHEVFYDTENPAACRWEAVR